MSSADSLTARSGGVEGPDIDAELAEVAGILNAQHGRLVEIVERALDTAEWQQSGVHSPAQWLALKAGLSPHRASEIVRCAERRRELPHVHAALSRGGLSIDQAVVANRAPAWADERVAEFATALTVSQLRRTITKQFFDEGAESAPAEPANEEADRLSTHVDGDGRWRLSGSGDVVRGSIVDAALAEAKNSLFERGHADPTRFDALVEIAERSLDPVTSPSRRDRFHTWIHIEAASGSASITDGHLIPTPIRDQLLCDGVVQPVWERDGVPFSVGRSQRVVPARTRRMIEHRDGGCCRVPGCDNRAYVEIHHVIHWMNGGTTDTWNLLCLCSKHHRLHHREQLGITGNADEPNGMTFTDHLGRPLDTCGRPTIPTRPPPKPETRYRHPSGEQMDYGYLTGWVHPDVLRTRRTRHRSP